MNSWFKLFSKIFLGLSVFLVIHAKQAMPQVSDAEMKQLEAELAAFQQELDAMPEKEREAFYKSMEEAAKRIDDMAKTPEGKELLDKLERGEISDDELNKLLDDLVAPPAEQPSVQPQPEPELP